MRKVYTFLLVALLVFLAGCTTTTNSGTTPNARATNDPQCATVTQIDPASTRGAAVRDEVQALVRARPETTNATVKSLKQITSADGWLIVQAEFEQLEPAVFLVRNQNERTELAAVWGGVVQYKGQMQDYFAQQASGVPQALLNCMQPQAPFTP